jgi:flagellar hook-basal body complex protein FliE
MAINEGIASLRIVGPEATPAIERPASVNGPAFGAELGQAVEALDRLQGEADLEVAKVAQGGGNLHEMAIALEKADIGLRLATKVRNKVVEAYQEIMRMSV